MDRIQEEYQQIIMKSKVSEQKMDMVLQEKTKIEE